MTTYQEPTYPAAKMVEDLLVRYGFSLWKVGLLCRMGTTGVRQIRQGRRRCGDEQLELLVALGELSRRVSSFGAEPEVYLETPVVAPSTLTPADMWQAGRRDLVADLVDGRDPLEVAEEFDSDWRHAYPPEVYKTVVATDGDRSIVARHPYDIAADVTALEATRRQAG